MTYTILVVVVLILVSGFIAYWGDILGRRMGKKRLTLFNLRPRHTAIVVTTITGMLISTLVLLAAVSFNAEFRKGFFQYGQILKSRRVLAKENGQLALRGKQLRIEVARQRNELADARKERDTAQGVVARLQRDIDARQKELVRLRERADATLDELNQRRGEVKLAQAELRIAQESLMRAKEQVVETESKLGAARAQLEDTTAKLSAVEAGSDTALDYVLRLRTTEPSFRQGDEIVRGVVDPTQSKFEKRTAFFNLLELASKKAIEGGAKVGENGRAVNVIYRQTTGTEGVLRVGDEGKYTNNAFEKIASSDSEVLVQIVCGMSALPDAQVPVEIRLYLNRLVYARGDKIAEAKIDGSRSEGYVLLALNSFLQTDVANNAMRAGVVPVSGREARSALGDNRQAQADELLRLVAEIKSMDAAADVSVYATADISAADSLNMGNIRFAVAKAK